MIRPVLASAAFLALAGFAPAQVVLTPTFALQGF